MSSSGCQMRLRSRSWDDDPLYWSRLESMDRKMMSNVAFGICWHSDGVWALKNGWGYVYMLYGSLRHETQTYSVHAESNMISRY